MEQKNMLPPPLMPHQREGVEFLRSVEGRALIADAPGLGKTAMVLTYLKEAGLKATVVTTKSFLYGWVKEAAVWWPGARVCVIEKGKDVVDVTADLCVVTYDVVRRSAMLAEHEGTAVVFDESHKIANRDTERSKIARRVAVTKKQIVCLSGTPQPNGQPQQLWPQLYMVFPKFFKWTDFAKRYCDAKRVWAPWVNGYLWDTTGSSNVDELRTVMSIRYLRRTKALLNLPSLTREWLPVPISVKREEGEAWKTYEGRLSEAKFPYVINLASESNDKGSKCLIFTQSTYVRDLLQAELEALTITAGMNAERRTLIVEQFQNDPKSRFFVATPQICAEGVTLTAADTVIFVDTPWSPGLIEQAQSRAHRKGQESPVQVYFLQSDTKYDRVVRETVERKEEVTEQLLEERVGG